MASERVANFLCPFLNLAHQFIRDGESPYSGSVPVAGRPAFLRLTVIDFAIITYNVKSKPRGSWNFRPGSNSSHKG